MSSHGIFPCIQGLLTASLAALSASSFLFRLTWAGIQQITTEIFLISNLCNKSCISSTSVCFGIKDLMASTALNEPLHIIILLTYSWT